MHADHCQPGLLWAAELDQIADAGAGDPGICNGPRLCENGLESVPAERLKANFPGIHFRWFRRSLGHPYPLIWTHKSLAYVARASRSPTTPRIAITRFML